MINKSIKYKGKHLKIKTGKKRKKKYSQKGGESSLFMSLKIFANNTNETLKNKFTTYTTGLYEMKKNTQNLFLSKINNFKNRFIKT
tara:strand:- start:1109 stop:1366 length:258 start_codon:yes stop_codon:yes gene_type:complete